MNQILISVVMSVYNSQKWLRESIESILNQSYTNFEFIIINDGSVDNSKKILDEYSKKDERIKVYDQKNSGLTISLNNAIRKSQGQFIARLDADDISCRDRLKQQLNEIKNKKLDLVASNFVEIDHMGNRLNFYDIRNKKNNLLNYFLGGNTLFPHSSVMFKKEAFNYLDGYNSYFKKSQDLDLWLRFYEKNFKIGFCKKKEPLVFIRKHKESITHNDYDDIYTCLAIFNYYFRNNSLNIDINSQNKNHENLKIKLRENKIYKVINERASIRDALKKILSWTNVNFYLKKLFFNLLRLSFLSINYYFFSNKYLYKKLFYQTLNYRK